MRSSFLRYPPPPAGESSKEACSRSDTLEPGAGTSNIQHPTSNIQWAPQRRSLDVGCWMLDVGCSQGSWKVCRRGERF
ncbi:MAG TPA: hypothetical protein VMU04_01545 [Candidatus Acidoferrum sp.]|nr:hypothetical protein [Candidatus Acidoferrum sp.]